MQYASAIIDVRLKIMNIDELMRKLQMRQGKLEDELALAKEHVSNLQREYDQVTAAIEQNETMIRMASSGLISVNRELESVPTRIIRLLRKHALGLATNRIIETLSSEDKNVNEGTIRSTLSRLKKEGRIVTENGMYMALKQESPEAATPGLSFSNGDAVAQ